MISQGHRDVWDYTPRQTAAFALMAARRHERETREMLSIMFAATRGDPKAVQKAIKDKP